MNARHIFEAANTLKMLLFGQKNAKFQAIFWVMLLSITTSFLANAQTRSADVEQLGRILTSCGKFKGILPKWKVEYKTTKISQGGILDIKWEQSTERADGIYRQPHYSYITLSQVESLSGSRTEDDTTLIRFYCSVGAQCARDGRGEVGYETFIEICTERHAIKAAEILVRLTDAKWLIK